MHQHVAIIEYPTCFHRLARSTYMPHHPIPFTKWYGMELLIASFLFTFQLMANLPASIWLVRCVTVPMVDDCKSFEMFCTANTHLHWLTISSYRNRNPNTMHRHAKRRHCSRLTVDRNSPATYYRPKFVQRNYFSTNMVDHWWVHSTIPLHFEGSRFCLPFSVWTKIFFLLWWIRSMDQQFTYRTLVA